MRLADTPVPARAGDDADPAGQLPPDAEPPAGAAPVFRETAFTAAAAALEAGRASVAEVRNDLMFEEWPAPKRLAPQATALAVTAYRDGVEAGTGRLMLLHDPEGRDDWTGTFRVVIQVQADVEEEMAADPLLGEVGWSWLTDALDLHAPGYDRPSGTVTREITEGYGGKSDEPPMTAFELRASWCPADEELEAELSGAVAAWCDLLAAAAGLPAQGTRTLERRDRGGAGSGRGPGPRGRRRP